MTPLAFLLALATPLPVAGASGSRLSDGSVSLFWTLPADPSVAGITVVREPIGGGGSQTFVLVGFPATFHDTTALAGVSYRYVVFTHDCCGVFSAGATVIITFHDVDDDGEVHFFCAASSSRPAAPAWGALLLLGLAALFLRRPAPTSGAPRRPSA